MNWSVFTSVRNYRITLWVYLVIIALLTLLPLNNKEAGLNHTYVVHIRLDYLLHCLVYLPFVTLFMGSKKRITMPVLLPAMAAGILLTTITESIQYYIPYRSYNINDLLANYLGLILGAFIPYLLSPGILGYKPAFIHQKNRVS